MLESGGARVVRFALMAITQPSDLAPIEKWVRALSGGGFDHVIFMSAEGVTRLVAIAERLGVKPDFIASLARIRKITRGPKPARVLRDLGLSVEVASSIPTSQGVMSCLRGASLAESHVGFQTLGDDGGTDLVNLLEARGARVHPVTPYRYETADDEGVAGILDLFTRSGLDALIFSSVTQIQRLFEVARHRGRESQLRTALAATFLAALGTSVVAHLRAYHIRVDSAPAARRHFLSRLARTIAEGIGGATGSGARV
jgi:uroporphyrinogen-III synthase